MTTSSSIQERIEKFERNVNPNAPRRKIRGKSAHEWSNRFSLVDANKSAESNGSRMHPSRSFEANLDHASDEQQRRTGINLSLNNLRHETKYYFLFFIIKSQVS